MAKSIALFACVATALCILYALGTAQTTEQPRSITAAELHKLQVIGWLGQRLGTIVTIEGVAADESYRRVKADLGHTLLRVQKVNGQPLGQECVFHFPLPGDAPKVGSPFKYHAYETGGFNGNPPDLGKYTPIPADVAYGFYTWLVIVPNELQPKK